MDTKQTWAIVRAVLLFIIVVLLGISILQSNNFEKRLIDIINRLERIESGGVGIRSLTPKGGGIAAPRKWLHPEVENFLVKEDFVLTPPEAKIGGKITRWYMSDSTTLNLITRTGAEVGNYVYNYVTDSLAKRHRKNPDLWKPKLAERIEITDDYKEYTIYLRPGVKWHKPAVDWSNPRYSWLKGDHYVTAHDIKFTLDIILNPQTECADLRNYYQDIKDYKVIDDYTIVIRWKKKLYNSLSSTVGLTPIPEFIYAYDGEGNRFSEETIGLKFNEHWYNKKAIGCGPYKFVSYETGVAIKLRRFEDYYDEKPAIKEINWLIYGDPKQNLLKLRSGEQDFGRLTPYQYREEILQGNPNSPFKDGRIKHKKVIRPVYFYIGWNLNNPLFADKRVRQAMTYACNRRAIIKNILTGLGVLTTGPIHINSPDYNRNIKPYEFDLKKAAKLLKQAGWEDKDKDGILEKIINGKKQKFEFNILIGAQNPTWKALASLYKEDLLKIGVKVNIQAAEWAVRLKKMNDREFDACIIGWTTSWDTDPYQIWHSSQVNIPKSSNFVSFGNKEVDKIIEKARETFDKSERKKLFHRFHQIIHEEQPYTFLFCRQEVYVWWNHVKRVSFKKVRPIDSSLSWYIDKG